MVARRRIRILAPYSRTHFFIDKGQPRGLIHDVGVALEEDINRQLKTTRETHVFVIVRPTSRDELYRALVEGRGDVIAAGLTVTPERQALVDFTVPGRRRVSEILVTGPGAALVERLDDLSGKLVHVRERSIQLQSLAKANEALAARGRQAIGVRTVPASLEDEDILEMVNAGIIKATIVDDYMAEFWSQVLPHLQLHRDIAVREGGDLAWAVRKGSPKLLSVLNTFAAAHPEGGAFRNVLFQKYLKSTQILRASTAPAELTNFEALQEVFKRYGQTYDLDYLLMMAQGYQESRLDQSVRSPVGAIGVMQVMPATGKDLQVGDIHQIDANVHAGVKYIRFTMDQFFANQPMTLIDKTLFAFAAYNCGPARLRQLRAEAARQKLDPNVWFNNVERVASARIGRETVEYVSNIYKYYIGYQLVLQEQRERAAVRRRVSGGG
jgi:membrane-bound lytic murein transglycosylase MltF